MGEEVSKEKKKDEKTDREELPRPNAPRQPEPIPSNVMYNPKHSTEQLTTAKGRKDNWQHQRPATEISKPKTTAVIQRQQQPQATKNVVSSSKDIIERTPPPTPPKKVLPWRKEEWEQKQKQKEKEMMQINANKKPIQEIPKPPAEVAALIEHNSPDVVLSPKESIPIITTPAKVKINLSRCMFFKQGGNSLYTHDAMQLLLAGSGWSVWSSLSTHDHLLESKIDVMKALKVTSEQLKVLNELGTFVLAQEKWGFLIELEQLDCIYEGDMSHILDRCVRIPFFQALMKRYAFHMLEEKSITLRDLRSTENDRRLNKDELKQCEILFPHQREEVGWMLNLERQPSMLIETNSMIPLFDSGYFFDPLDKDVKLRKIKELKEENLQRVPIYGAILASDIGSGKTASMLYLVHLSVVFEKAEHPTLVVTPDSILYQWADEIAKFTPSLNCQLLEKPQNVTQFKLKPFTNIILVSRSALAGLKNNSLEKIKFERIIIDEVHEIVKSLQKDKSSNNPQYFLRYQTKMIWGVTGTPHQVDYLSNLTVLGQLLRFPPKLYDELNVDIFRRCFLEHCIRKNANTKLLPAVTREIVYSKMQAVDNILYSAKASYAMDEEEARKICFNILPAFELSGGKSTIETGIRIVKQRLNNEIEKVETSLKKYTESESGRKPFVEKLHRLTSQNNFYNEIITILSKSEFECFICLCDRKIEELVLTECFHYSCDECYDQFFKNVLINQCPVCKAIMTKEKAIIHPKMKHSKNKIEMIMEALAKVKKNEKTIIFTQFHNLVERIGQEFRKAAVPFLELRGEPSEINYRLNVFRNDPSVEVLLLSIEQAASGINLTEANHVFFAHPILGNEYETMVRTYEQCIGRVCRIGQTKPVDAKLFVGEGTLEANYHNYFMNKK